MKIDLKDAQLSVFYAGAGDVVNFSVVKESASPELSVRVEFHLSAAATEDLRRALEAVREARAVVKEQERKRCKRCGGTGYEVIGEVCYAEMHGVCSKCGGSGRAEGCDP